MTELRTCRCGGAQVETDEDHGGPVSCGERECEGETTASSIKEDAVVERVNEKLESRRVTIDGGPIEDITVDKETGLQSDYVVLSESERAKGFVRPVRRSYVHDKCGKLTTMSLPLAETYAREPSFYSGTYCATCKGHFPVGATGEFKWAGTEERVGT